MTSLRPEFYFDHETAPTTPPPLPAVIQDIIDDHNELVAWLKELGYQPVATWLYRCEFAQLLAAIPTRDPTYQVFRESCETTDPYLLAQWLAQSGRHVTGRDIKQHRRRDCGCPPII